MNNGNMPYKEFEKLKNDEFIQEKDLSYLKK